MCTWIKKKWCNGDMKVVSQIRLHIYINKKALGTEILKSLIIEEISGEFSEYILHLVMHGLFDCMFY